MARAVQPVAADHEPTIGITMRPLHLFDSRRRNTAIVAGALDAAVERGQISDPGFRERRKLAKATADVTGDLNGEERAALVEDLFGDGDGEMLETVKVRVREKVGGSFLDIIKELLPLILPFLTCFA